MVNDVFDLLVCTLFGSELATEITLAGLKRPFSFCSVFDLVILENFDELKPFCSHIGAFCATLTLIFILKKIYIS